MPRTKQARKIKPSKPDIPLVHGQRFLKSPTVCIISAGFSGGQPKGGVDQGPAHLLRAGLKDQLESLDWTVELEPVDCLSTTSDTLQHKKIKNAAVADAVKKTCAIGHMPLTLGGDHSLAMGTISGTAAVYPGLGVVWVDAHADINTPDSTLSGNHAAEKKILKDNNIRAYSMYEVDKYGIGGVVDAALDYLGRDAPIHLTFDVDALDPSVAPATGTPVRGGLTFREGHYICEALYESGCVVGVDVVEVNPCIGGDVEKEQTVRIGCSLVRSALGETLL